RAAHWTRRALRARSQGMSAPADHASLLEAAYADRSQLSRPEVVAAVEATIEALDKGEIRVAEKGADGAWIVHAWIKQAILLYFGVAQMETIELGPYEYYDKV